MTWGELLAKLHELYPAQLNQLVGVYNEELDKVNFVSELGINDGVLVLVVDKSL